MIDVDASRSFIEQVAQRAYMDGFPASKNPKPRGTVDFHLWEAGELRMEHTDPILADERDLDAEIHLEGRIADEENAIANMVRQAREALPPIYDVASKLGTSWESWSGNCYGIASEIVNAGLVNGKAVFGHYHGPVDPKSPFAGRGVIQHGWIERPDGTIVDPTRWVFEDTTPRWHVSGNLHGDYDRGGQILMAAKLGDPPGPEPDAPTTALPVNEAADRWVRHFAGMDPAAVTTRQLFWIANCPVDLMGPVATDLHDALKEAEAGSLVPIDMWRMSREWAQQDRNEPATPAVAPTF